MLCKSVKSRKDIFCQCKRNATGTGDFCTIHSKAKTKQLYDPDILNPLYCDNQYDPISLETIWEVTTSDDNVDTVLHIAGSIDLNTIFCYKETIGTRTFQRGLEIQSLIYIIDQAKPKSPFTNLALEPELMDKIRIFINGSKYRPKKKTTSEELMLIQDEIIDNFQIFGSSCQRNLLSELPIEKKKAWLAEIIYLINDNDDNTQHVAVKFPINVRVCKSIFKCGPGDKFKLLFFKTILQMCKHSPIGTLLTWKALCWVAPELNLIPTFTW